MFDNREQRWSIGHRCFFVTVTTCRATRSTSSRVHAVSRDNPWAIRTISSHTRSDLRRRTSLEIGPPTASGYLVDSYGRLLANDSSRGEALVVHVPHVAESSREPPNRPDQPPDARDDPKSGQSNSHPRPSLPIKIVVRRNSGSLASGPNPSSLTHLWHSLSGNRGLNIDVVESR